jgi:hypothetical protein
VAEVLQDGTVVECSRGPACGSLHPDHHGWDCPLSDPLGDVTRQMMDPLDNPILERSRRALLADYGITVEEHLERGEN